MTSPIHDYLALLSTGAPLSAAAAESLFELILTGGADDSQIAAALAIIQTRRVHPDELLGAARAMHRHVITVPTEGLPGVILDTCGTGGAYKTFNVSTVAALVVAAAANGSVHVAKHGNKSRTGRGSAEALEALGVNIHASPAVQARCLRECNVCFSFAVAHHPAARFAATARRSLGFPTIFNLLGPLCNPARASHQVMGVFDPSYLQDMAMTLRALGSTNAIVLHGSANGHLPERGGGIDEFSTVGPTLAAVLSENRVVSVTLDGEGAGLARTTIDQLTTDSVEASAALALSVLSGQSGPCLDIVLLNAALALSVAGAVPDVKAGVELARETVLAGKALGTLNALIACSHTRT